MRYRIDRKASLVGFTASVIAIIALSGCSGDTQPDSRRPSPSTPIITPSATVSTVSAEDLSRPEILAAYDRAQELFERVQRNGRITDENIGDTLSGRARGLWTQVGIRYEQQHLRLEGTITRAPKVESIDLRAQPSVATITDCIDVSRARAVDSESGLIKANPPTPRYPQTVTLIKENGRWKMSDLVEDRSASC